MLFFSKVNLCNYFLSQPFNTMLFQLELCTLIIDAKNNMRILARFLQQATRSGLLPASTGCPRAARPPPQTTVQLVCRFILRLSHRTGSRLFSVKRGPIQFGSCRWPWVPAISRASSTRFIFSLSFPINFRHRYQKGGCALEHCLSAVRRSRRAVYLRGNCLFRLAESPTDRPTQWHLSTRLRQENIANTLLGILCVT